MALRERRLRMRPKDGLSVVLLVVSASFPGTSPAGDTVSAQQARTASHLEARLESLVNGGAGVEMAGIVVVRTDALDDEQSVAVGCARFAVDGRSCNRRLAAEQLLRVASVSKLFTAVAIHRLIDAHRLTLDADASGLLGHPLRNQGFPQQQITIGQLLSHTSSLRDAERYWIPAPGTLRELLADPGRFDRRAPGSRFAYANINYSVLAAVVERITQSRFDQFVADDLLRPANIIAGFNWQGLHALPVDLTATLYRRRAIDGEQWEPDGPWVAQVDALEGSPVPPLVAADYIPGSNPTLFSPHGGLRISPRDLARFLRRVFLPRADEVAVLTPHSRLALCRPVVDTRGGRMQGETQRGLFGQFGYGAQPKRLDGREWCGHFAEAYGLKGAALVDRRRGEVLVYFITGYADEPPLAGPRYAGLDAVEAAVLEAVLAGQ